MLSLITLPVTVSVSDMIVCVRANLIRSWVGVPCADSLCTGAGKHQRGKSGAEACIWLLWLLLWLYYG